MMSAEKSPKFTSFQAGFKFQLTDLSGSKAKS